ncbi:DUF805 domain-containing protein [bacterium M00.F.Ca.ET.141.01.1.1]|uniref:DUF805 domain-containing protein n=1 Tax=unclassified Mesorhizobium TaxID=325217 RepID=UPI000FD2CD58|nr:MULTISPECIES: DUF805 domain-containing protein [unclassified Mesorhizobium]RVD50538.1 DUF805 domain-containing protein [Mesorhizobium sp. M8A.F.Ca.ET.023.02.2.1]RWC67545.1 MAG: DUF805 domain-containing protein [Mesorhizobium sp.]TGR38682.1 DUF805 domain-containing protein [bacterium M00.F.Ca.ET.199.01.1.1]TGU28146.1 DUF805 domain-containing protein [bacterium M00.F.Ca.ET.156.01.1.1]TGV52767.1 DUF805 domain-containing protein [bacterium M00.F.Ca.ET.141.01.1.1]TGV83680.1 DUF805 domain-contai
MRGEVLHYDEVQGFGFITGADGNRYTFTRENLRRQTTMPTGTLVEFQASGGQARDVFSISARAASPAADAGASPAPAQTGPAPAAAASHAQHFGRMCEPTEPSDLWSYFWRGLTQNYFNFAGRARRKEYWGYCLFWMVCLLIIFGIGIFTDIEMGNFDTDVSAAVTVGLCGTFLLATFLPGLGMTVRRLHDIGLSGWLYLLILIPSIGSLIILVFALIPTQARENQWGPVPAGVRI